MQNRSIETDFIQFTFIQSLYRGYCCRHLKSDSWHWCTLPVRRNHPHLLLKIIWPETSFKYKTTIVNFRLRVDIMQKQSNRDTGCRRRNCQCHFVNCSLSYQKAGGSKLGLLLHSLHLQNEWVNFGCNWMQPRKKPIRSRRQTRLTARVISFPTSLL
jgi:hypothetical protein